MRSKSRTFLRVASLVLAVLLCVLVNMTAWAAERKPPVQKENTEVMPEYDSVFFIKKKDPILAGMLSWYMPGLGQYYSGEFFKGTLFLVTEYTLAITAIFYFLNFDFAAGGSSGFNLRVDAKRTDLGVVETSRRNVFYGMLVLVGILHIYNISDAVISAGKFNERLERRRERFRQRYPKLEFGYEERKGIYVGLQTKI